MGSKCPRYPSGSTRMSIEIHHIILQATPTPKSPEVGVLGMGNYNGRLYALIKQQIALKETVASSTLFDII